MTNMENPSFSDRLDYILEKADDVLGELTGLRDELESEREMINEMIAEVTERSDHIACSIDLNRKFED